jgi:streptogramin lyase
VRRALGLLVSASLVLAAGWVCAPPPASAAAVTTVPGLASATSGIAIGSDGNLWVAEQYADSVAKVSPSGAVQGRVSVGGAPIGVASGPGGSVWVTVPDLEKVVRIEVADGSHLDYSTAALADCGADAIADGGDGYMYLSFPCATTPKIGRIPVAGGVGAVAVSGRGTVFDLAVAGGKLYAPDFDGDVVRELDLSASLGIVSAVSTPAGSEPDGITVVGAKIYVTLFGAGGIASFPLNQSGGSAVSLPGVSGLSSPFGITPNASGGVIVTGKNSSNYAYVDGAGRAGLTPLPAGSKPFDAVTAPNGDVWVTDQNTTQIYRVVDNAPTGSLSAPKARTSSTAQVALTVDPHGNDSSWTVQYGLNTAYGKSISATVAGAAGPSPRTATLSKLKAGKTYHLRLVATNQRGTLTGPDLTFKMPKVTTSFKSSVSKAGTTLKSVKVTKLAAGETVTVTCGGAKGCPFKKKRLKDVKKGTLDLSALFRGKVLKPGVTVIVTISAKKMVDSTTSLTVQNGSAPQVS